MLNIARVSGNGNINIPMSIRKILGIKEGDKVVFVEKAGRIELLNSNRLAFEEFQEDMAGEAERIGWTTEEDVIKYCKEVRKKMWESRYESNA